jgi:DNA-binding MarR family transcriptional regulator
MRKTIFDQAVRDLGITRAQWWALSNLSRHKDDGMSQSDLARKLDVGKPTIGGLIDRLTERGLVERRLDGDDRRVRKLFITARGYEIISNMSPIAASLNDVFLENVPQDQVHIAELALEQMKKNLQKLLGSGSTLNLPEE